MVRRTRKMGMVLLGSGHANILIIVQLCLFFALKNALDGSFLYQKTHSNTNDPFGEWNLNCNNRSARGADPSLQSLGFIRRTSPTKKGNNPLLKFPGDVRQEGEVVFFHSCCLRGAVIFVDERDLDRPVFDYRRRE